MSAAEVAAFFCDTSALVKRHVNEIGSPWVRSLTRIRTAHTLYIASITAVEGLTVEDPNTHHLGDDARGLDVFRRVRETHQVIA